MRILIIILAILALLAAPVLSVLLGQLVPVVTLLLIGSILLLGALAGRKAAAHAVILLCSVLIALIAGSAFYQTQGFTRAEGITQYSDIWWLFGLGVGLVLAIAVAFGMLLLASDYILVAQGVGWRPALLYLFSWTTGLLPIYRAVKDGQVEETTIRIPLNLGSFIGRLLGIGRLMGTGEIVFIHSQHAVVFERSGKFTRVEGPGMVFTKPWEQIYKVFVTRPRFEEINLEEALTKDGIPIDITFNVVYRLMTDVSEENIDWKKPYPVSKEAVVRAAYATFDWERAVREEAKSLLREEIARKPLNELLLNPLAPDPFPLRKVTQSVKGELSNKAEDWGAQINSIQIVRLDAPEEAKRQLLLKWLAEIEKGIAEDRARARVIEAEGTRQALIERGRGQGEARAEIFGQILGSLWRGGKEPSKETIDQVILQLARAVKEIDVDESEQS